MPLPIRKNSDMDKMEMMTTEPLKKSDQFNVLPFLQQFFNFPTEDKKDKELLKRLWASSKSLGNNKIQIEGSFSEQDLSSLKSKGLIERKGKIISFTDFGAKLLRESILNDEMSSFTKQASKKLVAKNSYDFGEDVLVRVKDKEKFGSRYVAVTKKSFCKKANILPKKIKYYNIPIKRNDGTYKNIEDYTDEELITALHLAKRILDNSHRIIVSEKGIKSVPINRIKSFSNMILHELNSR